MLLGRLADARSRIQSMGKSVWYILPYQRARKLSKLRLIKINPRAHKEKDSHWSHFKTVFCCFIRKFYCLKNKESLHKSISLVIKNTVYISFSFISSCPLFIKKKNLIYLFMRDLVLFYYIPQGLKHLLNE